MNSKENTTIQSVLDMMNEENLVSREELIKAGKELGYKPVTVNYSIKKLKETNCIKEVKEGDLSMFEKVKNEYSGKTNSQKIIRTPGYRTKKVNYRKEIPELTEEQEEFKNLVNDNRDELFNKKVIWTDKNGMTFPLTIAGMGDITLRCRFFLANFMESEPQTGALVYIPWHDEMISQLHDQINELLTPENEIQECVNFQMAPAK